MVGSAGCVRCGFVVRTVGARLLHVSFKLPEKKNLSYTPPTIAVTFIAVKTFTFVMKKN